MNNTAWHTDQVFIRGYSPPLDRQTPPTVISLTFFKLTHQAHVEKAANWLSENDQISKNDPSDVIEMSLKEQMSHVAIAGQRFHVLWLWGIIMENCDQGINHTRVTHTYKLCYYLSPVLRNSRLPLDSPVVNHHIAYDKFFCWHISYLWPWLIHADNRQKSHSVIYLMPNWKRECLHSVALIIQKAALSPSPTKHYAWKEENQISITFYLQGRSPPLTNSWSFFSPSLKQTVYRYPMKQQKQQMDTYNELDSKIDSDIPQVQNREDSRGPSPKQWSSTILSQYFNALYSCGFGIKMSLISAPGHTQKVQMQNSLRSEELKSMVRFLIINGKCWLLFI